MKSTNPLPIWGVLGILLTCAITYYLLIPNQKALVNRLARDGKVKRALQVMRSLPQSEKARDPDFYELMRLRLNRQLLSPPDPAALIAQVEQALRAFERSSSNREFLVEVLRSVSMLNDGEQALRLVVPHLKAIPDVSRRELARVLVRDALAADQPEVAAATYERCLWPFPHSGTNLVEAVRLWRAADRTDQALRVVENVSRQPGQDGESNPMLGEMKFHLLLELGRDRDAFELASGLARKNENGEAALKWLNRMVATVGNAAQSRELLDAYRRRAQANPEDAATWRLIADWSLRTDDLTLAKKAFGELLRLEPEDGAAQMQLAQLYEWTDEPNRAFDLYIKLAERKSDTALARLVDLNPGLYRDKDILRLLRAGVGEDGQDRYQLILARLLIKEGEYSEANSFYEKYLQRTSGDIGVLEEYAQALKRQQAYEGALAVWKSLREFKPEDTAVAGNIAEMYYLLGDFEASLRAYQQLAKRSTDLEIIQKYSTLAEALGDFRSLSEALGREMELKSQVTPDNFLKLAYVYNLLGADVERQGALERGLARFPDNDMLRINLCLVLMAKKNEGLALPILARSRHLKTDLDTLRLYLDLLIGRGEFAAGEKLLRSGIDEKLLNAESISLLQALIYEGNKNDVALEKIRLKLYQRHPGVIAHALNYLSILTKLGKTQEARRVLPTLLKKPTPALLKEAAHVYAELGDYQEAARLQTRFVELSGDVGFQDLIYLGNVRYSAGNRSSARHAYRQALAAAEKNLKSQSP
jgi:predicted Zn-dependent protease